LNHALCVVFARPGESGCGQLDPRLKNEIAPPAA
jgi:hypothetical protein